MIRVSMGNSEFVIECNVSIDGNLYCVTGIDWHFATMPAGFGSTIPDAVANFRSEVRNATIKTGV